MENKPWKCKSILKLTPVILPVITHRTLPSFVCCTGSLILFTGSVTAEGEGSERSFLWAQHRTEDIWVLLWMGINGIFTQPCHKLAILFKLEKSETWLHLMGNMNTWVVMPRQLSIYSEKEGKFRTNSSLWRNNFIYIYINWNCLVSITVLNGLQSDTILIYCEWVSCQYLVIFLHYLWYWPLRRMSYTPEGRFPIRTSRFIGRYRTFWWLPYPHV